MRWFLKTFVRYGCKVSCAIASRLLISCLILPSCVRTPPGCTYRGMMRSTWYSGLSMSKPICPLQWQWTYCLTFRLPRPLGSNIASVLPLAMLGLIPSRSNSVMMTSMVTFSIGTMRWTSSVSAATTASSAQTIAPPGTIWSPGSLKKPISPFQGSGRQIPRCCRQSLMRCR